jgi:hypothetical protein
MLVRRVKGGRGPRGWNGRTAPEHLAPAPRGAALRAMVRFVESRRSDELVM